METNYLERFGRLAAELKDRAILRGNNYLVEIVDEPDIEVGGIIIARDKDHIKKSVHADRPVVGVIIYQGEGYFQYNEETKEREDIPLEYAVGTVIMVPANSIPLSVFPGMPGITRDKLMVVNEDSIVFVYKDMEAYNEARKVLND